MTKPKPADSVHPKPGAGLTQTLGYDNTLEIPKELRTPAAKTPAPSNPPGSSTVAYESPAPKAPPSPAATPHLPPAARPSRAPIHETIGYDSQVLSPFKLPQQGEPRELLEDRWSTELEPPRTSRPATRPSQPEPPSASEPELSLGAEPDAESLSAPQAPVSSVPPSSSASGQATPSRTRSPTEDGGAASAVRRTLQQPRGATLPGRTTVLPRSLPVAPGGSSGAWVLDARPRYEPRKLLGEGGNGVVTLEHDADIDRVVAVKRLRKEAAGEEGLLRFAEEVRVVGQLEHPNIVPVHDVGVDEQGDHYFVMKFVQGETLETIIDKLAAGDPRYLAHYTVERRANIATEVMNALAYAHAQGYVHRDLKPANVMVGKYGEVLVMDWGLARKVREASAPAPTGPDAPAAPAGDASQGDTERDRIFRTRHGSLLGTPAYMAPEQARGENEKVDERSDIYSLSVMLHELFFLRHYLTGKNTVAEVLVSVAHGEELTLGDFTPDLRAANAPPEYLHFARRGLRRSAAERFQSVSEMLEVFTRLRSGDFAIQCPCTMVKQGTNGLNRVIDRFPIAMPAVLIVLALFALYGMSSAVWRLVVRA